MSQYETSGRDGHHVYRRLGISGKRGSAILDSYEVPVDYGLLEGVLTGRAGSNPLFAPNSDEAAALGRFLAQITGWTLLGA